MKIYIVLFIAVIVTNNLATDNHQGCLNVYNCFCADDGQKCISPKVFPNNLVGYFNFNELRKVDQIGNFELMTSPSGGPGFGGEGMSLYVEHDSNYAVTSKNDLGITEMSVMFWVYVIESGTYGYRSIISKMKSDMTNVTPTIKYSTHGSVIELILTTVGTNVSGLSEPEPTSIITNGALMPFKWTHLAFTISPSTAAIYINGMMDKNRSFNQYIQFNQENWVIGENAVVDGVDMQFDEFKIFDKVLTDDEIWNNYGNGQAPWIYKQFSQSCQQCEMSEAIDNCPKNMHLCSEQEVLSGAWQVARSNGWLRKTQKLWFTSQQSAANTEKERLSNDLRAAICCQNRG